MHTDRDVFLAITFRRAQVLRELADGYSESEAAAHLGVTISGFRASVQQLKDLTGCASVRELGRWGRAREEQNDASTVTRTGSNTECKLPVVLRRRLDRGLACDRRWGLRCGSLGWRERSTGVASRFRNNLRRTQRSRGNGAPDHGLRG